MKQWCRVCGSTVHQVSEVMTGHVDLRVRRDGVLTCYERRGQPHTKADPRLLGPQYAWKPEWVVDRGLWL